MDLKAYYRRIRETEASFEDEFPVVKSLATESGGCAGRLTETTRAVAALERSELVQLQFAVLSEADLRALTQGGPRGRKE